jgi:hypothetical protein
MGIVFGAVDVNANYKLNSSDAEELNKVMIVC